MNGMELVPVILIVAGVFMVFWMLKSQGQIAPQAAQAHLNHGALVIDVRSPGEFRSGHAPGARNFPLDEIAAALPAQVPDRNQVLLLYCQSGTRSSLARTRLKNLGYQKTFNLGSLGRAQSIAKAAKAGAARRGS